MRTREEIERKIKELEEEPIKTLMGEVFIGQSRNYIYSQAFIAALRWVLGGDA